MSPPNTPTWGSLVPGVGRSDPPEPQFKPGGDHEAGPWDQPRPRCAPRLVAARPGCGRNRGGGGGPPRETQGAPA